MAIINANISQKNHCLMTNHQMIFDIGMHEGQDTDFYLRKGFKVVAVEANPALAASAARRFAAAIASAQLTIVNKAIADVPGTIEFYINEKLSVWGTASRDWMERNAKLGAPSTMIEVPTMSMAALFSAYGMPYFMKVDIEGYDQLCIRALIDRDDRPDFTSIESHAWLYDETLADLELLRQAGYTKFKIIPQHDIMRQRPPAKSLEGLPIDYTFVSGSSGLFGRELPGRWMSFDQTCARYRHIYRNVRMVGMHNGRFRDVKNRYVKAALNRVFAGGTGWYDTHATS